MRLPIAVRPAPRGDTRANSKPPSCRRASIDRRARDTARPRGRSVQRKRQREVLYGRGTGRAWDRTLVSGTFFNKSSTDIVSTAAAPDAGRADMAESKGAYAEPSLTST